MVDSVVQAQMNLDAAGAETKIQDAAADKGYHKASTLELADNLDFRTYVPEPKRRYRYRWIDKATGQKEAVYANRRRVRGERGKRLQRERSEKVERSFAHVCETGGARRTWLRGLEEVSKRYLLQVAARNLGLVLRKLFGVGTARSLQGLAGLFWAAYYAVTSVWLTIASCIDPGAIRKRPPLSALPFATAGAK